MPFKKLLQKTLLGLALLLYLFLGVEQNSLWAATVTQPNTFPDLELEVDQFLTSIPSGYYTIGSVEKLKSLLNSRQLLLVDVRESSEYNSGHIPNAINIPIRTLAENLDKIPSDRPVVVYCTTGYRSAMGVMTLHLLGYDNVQGFPPSFAAWKSAGEAIAMSGKTQSIVGASDH
ncbi:MAG: rhodanese-like domain-containing protein [Limnoraphis robusta]|jgi:rhodanese-related sulfurtransferase